MVSSHFRCASDEPLQAGVVCRREGQLQAQLVRRATTPLGRMDETSMNDPMAIHQNGLPYIVRNKLVMCSLIRVLIGLAISAFSVLVRLE